MLDQRPAPAKLPARRTSFREPTATTELPRPRPRAMPSERHLKAMGGPGPAILLLRHPGIHWSRTAAFCMRLAPLPIAKRAGSGCVPRTSLPEGCRGPR